MSPMKPVTITRPRWMVVAAVAAAVALPFASWVVGSTVSKNADDAVDNCARIHAIVKVGGEIIASGRVDLEKYRDEGTITQAQFVRARRAVDERLRRWNTADCPPRTVGP